MADYREFLRALRGEPGRATIFEPFIERGLVTRLIWRGGRELWNTAEHTVATLSFLYSYIKSDVVIIDARENDIEKLLYFANELPCGMKAVVVSDNPEALAYAGKNDNVCALASTSETAIETAKPLIHIGESLPDGFGGYYVTDGAERLLSDKRRIILGGLGVSYLNSAEPLEIHRRAAKLYEESGRTWIFGSGGLGEKTDYLGFISMLGIYNCCD